MKITVFQKIIAAIVLAAMLVPMTAQPAKANGAQTTSTLLIAGAAAALLFTAANVSNKNAVANRVEGYLPDGSTVYGDGHVVAPNGQSWYPGNQGQQVNCNNGSCYITENGNNTGYNGNNGYNNGYGYNDGYNGYDRNGRHNRGGWGH